MLSGHRLTGADKISLAPGSGALSRRCQALITFRPYIQQHRQVLVHRQASHASDTVASSHAADSQQQQQAQNDVPATAAAPPPPAMGLPGAPGLSPEQMLQQMQAQQMALLQQQVAVLTQLLQQSQQQNANLTNQVQQMNQQLNIIQQQVQQQNMQQEHAAGGTSDAQPVAQQQQQQQFTDQVEQLNQEGDSIQQQLQQQQPSASSPDLPLAPMHQQQQQVPPQVAANYDNMTAPNQTDLQQSDLQEQQQQQDDESAASASQDTGVQPYSDIEPLQTVGVLQQQQPSGVQPLEHQHLAQQEDHHHQQQHSDQAAGVTTPAQPEDLTATAAAAAAATVGATAAELPAEATAAKAGAVDPLADWQPQQQQQSQLRAQEDSYTAALRSCRGLHRLQQLYESSAHALEPWQLVPTFTRVAAYVRNSSSSANSQQQQQQKHVRLKQGTPDSGAELAIRVLSQLLNHPRLWQPAAAAARPPACGLSPEEVTQLLVAAASLPFGLPASCMPALQVLAAAAAACEDPDMQQQQQFRQVQLVGSCMVLGLRLSQQQLQQLLRPVTADAVRSNGDVLTCAMLVYIASVPLPLPAAAGLIDTAVVAAAMERLATAGGLMNRHLGYERIKSLLLLPLVKLGSFWQQQQQGDETAAVADVCSKTAAVCNAVQYALVSGLQAAWQQQQQQGNQRQLHKQQRSYNGGSNKQQQQQQQQAVTGGWNVVDAALVLLMMVDKLNCQVRLGTLSVFTSAAGQQLESLPDQLIVPVTQMVQQQAAVAAAAAGTADPQHQQKRYVFVNWRRAVLQHLEHSRDRIPFDEAVAGVVALALHHTQETAAAATAAAATAAAATAAAATDSSSSSIHVSFLSECDRVLSEAAQWQLAAVTADSGSSNTGSGGSSDGYYRYSQQQLARLIPELVPAGLNPSSETTTALLLLLLVAPQQQQHRRPGDAVTAADLAAALNAVVALPNKPEQQVLQQLAAAVQHRMTAATSSSSSSGDSHLMTASEACALVTAISPAHGIISSSSGGVQTAAAGSVNMSKLGDLCYIVYQDMGSLPGNALSGLITALADLDIPLNKPLGARAVTDAKASVTYSDVVAAAAAAAALPETVATTSPHAVAGLLVALHRLLQPHRQQQGRQQLLLQLDDDWQQCMLGRLQGNLNGLSAEKLHQLLASVVGLGMMPNGDWLSEACKVSLSQYNSTDSSTTPTTLLQQQAQAAVAAAHLINCASLLITLGCQLPAEYQQTLVAAVDQQILQPTNASAAGSSSNIGGLLPTTAAQLLADAGVVLAKARSDDSNSQGGVQSTESWLRGFASAMLRLLPAAEGDCCCRLAAAAAGLQCQMSAAHVRELQQQIESKLSAVSAEGVMTAIVAVADMNGRPSSLLANALVIKTQQQLMTAPAAAAAAANAHSNRNTQSSSSAMLSCGLDGIALAAAAAALAATGSKVPQAWCAAAVQHLAAAAAVLPPQQLYQTAAAAKAWGIKPVPQPLLQAISSRFTSSTTEAAAEDDDTVAVITHFNSGDEDGSDFASKSLGLSKHQLQTLAEVLVNAGQAVPDALTQYVPAKQPSGATLGSAALPARSQAAAVASSLLQEMQTTIKQGTGNYAAMVAAAAALKEQSPEALLGLVRSAESWAAFLRCAANVQQQQQHFAEFLEHPDVATLLCTVAAAVQSVPHETARSNASGPGGPDSLIALVRLSLTIRPEWLDQVLMDMDRSALSKNSWFKQAGLQDIVHYSQALDAVNRQISLQQLEAVAKFLPKLVQQCSTGCAALLVQLLGLLPLAAAGQQRQKQQRQQQLLQQIVSAVVPVAVAAARSGELQLDGVQQLLVNLLRVDCNIFIQTVGNSSSSSVRSSSDPALTLDDKLLLLQAAMPSPSSSNSSSEQPQQQQQLSGDSLLACMQIAAHLPTDQQQTLDTVYQQLIMLFQQYIAAATAADLQLPTPKAAQFFCAAVRLAVASNPALKSGAATPHYELGGCLQQLLADIEQDWSSVAAAELAAAPRQAAAVGLELSCQEDFVSAVQQQLRQLVQTVGPAPWLVTQASNNGYGPVQLLEAVVFVVMNTKRAELGNTTWQGLDQFVVRSTDSQKPGDTDGQLYISQELFNLVTQAVNVTVTNLSVGLLADLVHMFMLGGAGSQACSWVSPAMARVWQVRLLLQLSPKQQQALLVCMEQELRSDEALKHGQVTNLLKACLESVPAWSPQMITFTLLVVGRLLTKWPGEIHQDLMQAVSTWQQSALAALQPHIGQLPSECLVHLLLGNYRIQERLTKNASNHQRDGSIGDVAAGAAAAGVLAAAVAAAVARVDELGPGQLGDLLRALSQVDGVGSEVASQIMSKLEQHLRSLPLHQQVNILTAYASWPADRRPPMDPQWAVSFLATMEQHINKAVPITTSSQQMQDDVDIAADSSAIPPSVLIDLAYGVPFLSIMPSRGWQSQYLLALTGQLSMFRSPQAAEMLNALSYWRAAVLNAVGSSSSSVPNSVDPATANIPLPLIDSLVMLVASGCNMQQAGGALNSRLSIAAIEKLPAALRVLSWPVDPQVVTSLMGVVAHDQARVQAGKAKAATLLEQANKMLLQLQDAEQQPQQQQQQQSKKKQAKKGKRGGVSNTSGPGLAQQKATLQEQIDGYQGWVDEADGLINRLQEIGLSWQEMLTKEDGNSSSVGSSRSSSSFGGSSSSSSGLDVDGLMSSMLAAAGMPGVGSAVAGAEGDSCAEGIDSPAFAGMEMDELLGVLDAAAVMAEQQGFGASEDDGTYIDTTAVDVTQQ